MNITPQMLVDMRACREARNWFVAMFPAGTDLRTAWAACPRDDWRIYFALRQMSKERVVAFGWWCAGQAFRYAAIGAPVLTQFAGNVTPQNWREAYATAHAVNASDAADAAAYASASALATNVADANHVAFYASESAAHADAATRAEHARWCAKVLFAQLAEQEPT